MPNYLKELFIDDAKSALYSCTGVTLTDEQIDNAVNNYMENNVDLLDESEISYFGMRYSDATQIVRFSDSVKMYLFSTSSGYDAVVAGEGEIPDHTEDSRPYTVEQIERLHICDGITSIGDYFMCGAYNLTHLSFDDSTAVTHLGVYAFAKTQINGEYDFSGITDSEINNTFWCCPKLEGLIFNSGVTSIADNAFQFCLSLRYVRGITGVTAIGKSAFQVCACLENVDIVPENVTIGEWAFVSTPKNAAANSIILSEAAWANKASLSFVQNKWTADQLAAIRTVTSDSVFLPVPESDNQKTAFYKQWGVFPLIVDGVFYPKGHPASGCCGIYCLYHIYNIMNPNTAYDTFYDFITREVDPRKIEVTESLASALECENGQILITNNTGVSYEVGNKISALDLPMGLSSDESTWGAVGTSHWGICEALGWTATRTLFGSGAESGAVVKQIILDNLSDKKPVLMEIVAAGGSGHGAHAVTAIGYNAETDKLSIIDSTWEFPSDIVPMTYELPFETLITPNEESAIWTYDFGEVITMTDIDNKLATLMKSVNSGFHAESGAYVAETDLVDSSGVVWLTIPCTSGAKLLLLTPDDEIVSDADGYTTYNRITKGTSASDGAGWLVGAMNNAMISLGGRKNKGLMSYMGEVPNGSSTYWLPIYGNNTSDNTDGFKFTVPALKAGIYRWSAFYWNE